MRILGFGYRRRTQFRDGKHLDLFANTDLGIPSVSARLFDRITFNPTARRGNRLTVRIAKGWTWKM